MCVCVCVCLCRFSAWKDGWRGTSAEELLLVTVREKRKRKESEDGERESVDKSNTADQREALPVFTWVFFFILKIITLIILHTLLSSGTRALW